MKIYDGSQEKCYICNKVIGFNNKCVLVAVDGILNDRFENSLPVHLDCIPQLRFTNNKKIMYGELEK